MLELTLLSFRVRYTMAANRLLHFLRRLPVLKKVIPQSVYGDHVLKAVLTVLGTLFVASKKLMMHIMYMLFLVVVGVFVNQVNVYGGFAGLFAADSWFNGMTATSVAHYILFAWFIISFIGSPAQSNIIDYDGIKNDEIMLNYLRADPALYGKSRIVIDRISNFVLYVPFLIIAFLIARLPIWGVLTALILFTAIRMVGDVINLAMYKKFRYHFGRYPLAYPGLAILLAVVVLGPVYTNMTDLVVALMINPIVALVSLPIGFFAWLYIKDFPLYRKMLIEKIQRYNYQLNKYAAYQAGGNTLDFVDAKKWSKNLQTEDLQLDKDKYDHKKGFEYLNAIFFDRHSMYFRKKLLIRCLIFAALPAAAVLLTLFGSAFGMYSIADMLGFGDTLLSDFFYLAPVFFFIIYIASMGRIATASVFTNCDIHMLHYPYYRTSETIFASFKARLKAILRYNIVITTIMYFSVVSTLGLVFGDMDYLHAGVFFVLLTAIGVFFAFNDLFLYYVIQPYDEAGKGKSIVYTIINYAIYAIAWFNFYARFDFYLYSAIIVIATFLYFGVGIVLLRKLAPKRFKLR